MNLIALERSVRAVLSPAGVAASPALLAMLTLVLRTVLFFTAVIYVLAFTPVQPLAFVAGLLAIVPAALWHGLTPPAPRT